MTIQTDATILGYQETKANARAASHGQQPWELVVFADDWGRHPSSAQHLVRRLLPRHPAVWVSTIGTRRPQLNIADVRRAARKLTQWLRPAPDPDAARVPHNLRLAHPRMLPGFRSSYQRRVNSAWISSQVNRILDENGQADPPPRRIALTTLPITADLVGKLHVDRWLYYCVDDFSVWPGLDGNVMCTMEKDLIQRVDAAVAVSQTLADRLESLGASAALLTHGIDLSHWQHNTRRIAAMPEWVHKLPTPIALFWGLIDRRLDTPTCTALAQAMHSLGGCLALVGPQQSPDPALAQTPGLVMPGPIAYEQLPTLAQCANVLVMPYADLPVTRAMQPLKLTEYLATGQPAVVADLPATRPWADAADVVADPQTFVERTLHRIDHALTDEQHKARRRLTDETWDAKANQLHAILHNLLP